MQESLNYGKYFLINGEKLTEHSFGFKRWKSQESEKWSREIAHSASFAVSKSIFRLLVEGDEDVRERNIACMQDILWSLPDILKALSKREKEKKFY